MAIRGGGGGGGGLLDTVTAWEEQFGGIMAIRGEGGLLDTVTAWEEQFGGIMAIRGGGATRYGNSLGGTIWWHNGD